MNLASATFQIGTLMKRPGRRGLLLMMFSLCLVAAFSGSGSASQAADTKAAQVVGADDEFSREQVEAYEADFQVSEEEALKALRLQEPAADVLGAVAEAAGSELAVARLVRRPELQIEVKLTPQADVAAVRAALAKSPVPYDLATTSAISQTELSKIAESHADEWVKRFPGLMGIDSEGATGTIALDLAGVSQDEATAIAEKVEMELDNQAVTVDGRVAAGDVGDGRRGGFDMQTATGGTCTLGFSIKTQGGGPWGIVTAGHCINSLWWRNFSGGGWQPSTWQDAKHSGDADLQWHTITPTPEALYHGSSTANATAVQGSVTRSAMLGLSTCHRGQTTGWSCGYVASITYMPTYQDACPSTCLAEWPRVEGANLACYPGDSGGPYASAFTAFGVYKGQSTNGTGQGQCFWSIFTPIGKVSLMGMELLTQ